MLSVKLKVHQKVGRRPRRGSQLGDIQRLIDVPRRGTSLATIELLLVILPPTRSFSINGLRLTNAKTSFATGFGLHHWSILEGELR